MGSGSWRWFSACQTAPCWSLFTGNSLTMSGGERSCCCCCCCCYHVTLGCRRHAEGVEQGRCQRLFRPFNKSFIDFLCIAGSIHQGSLQNSIREIFQILSFAPSETSHDCAVQLTVHFLVTGEFLLSLPVSRSSHSHQSSAFHARCSLFAQRNPPQRCDIFVE